ncbi:hypothetical protein KC853_01285 [Candidatus Saccharibacteria bacterium]|nr:hypothetical protein [Candidatus Saccharibacteria bacterium]MCB9834880.1 hypothetical protein [Candidatus Nomurabacteria bacterium]
MAAEIDPTSLPDGQKPTDELDSDQLPTKLLTHQIIVPDNGDCNYCLVPITERGTSTSGVEPYHPRDLLELIRANHRPDCEDTPADTVAQLVQEY